MCRSITDFLDRPVGDIGTKADRKEVYREAKSMLACEMYTAIAIIHKQSDRLLPHERRHVQRILIGLDVAIEGIDEILAPK